MSPLPDPNTLLGFRCIQLLDWLSDMRLERPNVLPDVRFFLARLDLATDVDEEEAPEWLPHVLSTLGSSGLVNLHKVLSSYLDFGLQLTDEGLRDIAERAERRRDRPARRAVARRGVLRWLDDVSADVHYWPELQTIFSSPWGTYEGEYLTIGDVVGACEYLMAQKLVADAPLRLTAAGNDCVDNHGGDVSQYFEDQKPRSNFTTHFHQQVGNLQLAQGNHDVQQNQRVEGMSGADLALLAQALREAAPVLGLSEAKQAELAHVATQMEEAAEGDELPQSRVQQLMNWGRTILTDASQSALAQILIAITGGVAGG
ncbi:hypothetical protein amrb99_51360 [Actinomadura sp. RB99]|nr:hypothetical protein [Actinomadura sp. RB99]